MGLLWDTFQANQSLLCTDLLTIQSVIKNNDRKLDGLTVRNQNSNIFPNIYLNQFFRDYDDGRDIDKIMREIASVRIRSDNGDFPMIADLTCLDIIKNKIHAKLVNRSRNEEYLADKPFTVVADLAAIYYIELDKSEHGNASVVITNNMLDIISDLSEHKNIICQKITNGTCEERNILLGYELYFFLFPMLFSLKLPSTFSTGFLSEKYRKRRFWDNYDFSPIDAIREYAHKKGCDH